ncbi:MAG: high frequency lysogenization protein HflD [Rhodospirillaceae bacterium]|nr:high frequency lysogenization protein HflD [Rhodospirillaceae bacterium]
MLQHLTVWVLQQSSALHAQLVDGVRAAAETAGAGGAAGLIGLAFLYGVFHAAGPGHGKAVIATYLATRRERLARGVALAVLGAACQGLTAILLVYGLIGLAGWMPRETSTAVDWSERASFVLLALIGALLLVRALATLWQVAAKRRGRAPPAAVDAQARADEAGHGHGHSHSHSHSHGCGHSHVPEPDRMAAGTGLKAMALIVLSIGLRPCTGAILVLVFAKVVGVPWTGVFAVLAMSTGTALAVGTLAVLTVALRTWIAGLAAARQGSDTLAIGRGAVLLVGGSVLLVLGAALLIASFNTAPHPLGL